VVLQKFAVVAQLRERAGALHSGQYGGNDKLKLFGVCLARDTLLSILADLISATRGEAVQISTTTKFPARGTYFNNRRNTLLCRTLGQLCTKFIAFGTL